MPSYYTKLFTNSSICHCCLVDNLDKGNLNMHLCKECVSQDVACLMGKDTGKCNKCTCFSLRKCNLVLSEAKWVKVKWEHLHLWQEVQEMTAQLICLQKQQDLMKFCWEEMICWKLQNIEELEANEAQKASETAAEPFLNEFLLNMSSNQVGLSDCFNL